MLYWEQKLERRKTIFSFVRVYYHHSRDSQWKFVQSLVIADFWFWVIIWEEVKEVRIESTTFDLILQKIQRVSISAKKTCTFKEMQLYVFDLCMFDIFTNHLKRDWPLIWPRLPMFLRQLLLLSVPERTNHTTEAEQTLWNWLLQMIKWIIKLNEHTDSLLFENGLCFHSTSYFQTYVLWEWEGCW